MKTADMTDRELEAKLWNDEPDTAFADVTDEDFDRLLIDVYGADGSPYMDEFEYIDACICNRGVEKRRAVFHAWRDAHGCNSSSLHHEK
jgi:hypothetical protein